ncbi:hypothetical protein K490DRAFT_73867 [Saccharata proteae CBS 121410]|uniref:ATP-dependent DNA ligase family profile domain-containing protein n=1 Tax=Saccharata proteae CBS 121410 TaxID=1314787 RepID=A0A9P4HT47_9PEZI|nr:hypothetical protein K490DRAFT_73867 [Saccharata proteae CBS 121410]
MPFKFSSICDLLESLERIELRDPPLLRDRKALEKQKVVLDWFRQHRKAIDAPDCNGVAILSTLFPERRTDRVYGIQALRLQRLAARCLRLTVQKAKELERWKTAGNGDLGACIERVQKDYDGSPLPGPSPLYVEDVDSALANLASKVRFSSPEARRTVSAAEPLEILGPIYLKTHSREAKWLTRLILKDFGRVVLDEYLILREFHFMLPPLLNFQNNLSAAIAYLKGPLHRYHSKPDPQSQRLFLEEASLLINPQIGVKIGKPTWYKARSMDNCLKMVGRSTWTIERKYDGEYCEIHVDLTKGKDCIRIFSKVGKDATADRHGLIDTIKECLLIGRPECRIKKQCILLGEMVVYSDLEGKVLEFHKIRKHVSRSGSFLGTMKDSQKHAHEHLMIEFFDVLLHDDEIVMAKPVTERRNKLSLLFTKIPGRAMSTEWKIVDFSNSRKALATLKYQFAAALAFRCEGLILKPNLPYFSLAGEENGTWCKGFIKLKKDYMTDMGGERDVADFAIIGASYEAKQAQKCDLKFFKWTNYYLGCLTNKEDLRFSDKPVFKVVGIIKQEQCIPRSELKYLNEHGQFRHVAYDSETPIETFRIQLGSNPPPAVVFTKPFVAEILGSAYDKPPNENFFMLRHPRILKVHTDRTWQDCITMDGLREMADEARNIPEENITDEIKNNINIEHAARNAIRRPLAEISPPKKTRNVAADQHNQPVTVSPNRLSSISSNIFNKPFNSENVKPPANTAPPKASTKVHEPDLANLQQKSPSPYSKRERSVDDFDIGFDSPRKTRRSVLGLRDLSGAPGR